MTIQLTPLSADTYGLAVVEKSVNGFKVKELMNHQGNFYFDWEVKCRNEAFKDFQVYEENDPPVRATIENDQQP